MAMQRTLAMRALVSALVLLSVGKLEAQGGGFVYDEGNVGDEYYSQPGYFLPDDEPTGLQETASYELPESDTVSGEYPYQTQESQTQESQGHVSFAGFDVTEPGDEDDGEDGEAPVPSPPSKSAGCVMTGNPIDDCWRCDPNWASNRQKLASCAVGFGRNAIGGKNGKIYVVTSNVDDPANPAPGTLRYGCTRLEPLWIVFAFSMTIKLKLELMFTSFKTVDGRGVTVHIAGGGGLKFNAQTNIILHSIAIHDIVVTGPGNIMMTPTKVQKRNKCDGDAISVFASKDIWIDHCYFSKTADGLVDVIKGSNGVTISNNYFANHDKVMLFGASAKDKMDKDMHVTVAYNKFGPGLIQRMPRVRFGVAHIVNNEYAWGWKQYAIGGSEGPTILSQGNVYNAYNNCPKQVSKRINDGGPTMGGPGSWSWKSEGDVFQSGAYFASIAMKWSSKAYSETSSCSARPASMVPKMTKDAGPLLCKVGSHCSA